VPFIRGALHDEQRTTAASCTRKRGTSMISPHAQWKRLPALNPSASYCRRQLEQATRTRLVAVAVVTVVLLAGRTRHGRI
jgi:hypothetical protein